MKFPNGQYDNDQIKVLMKALDLTCKELGISEAETEDRQALATVMMAMASGVDFEPERLSHHAVAAYRGKFD